MTDHRYAICLNNEDYPVSLEKGKLYRVLDPLDRDPSGYIRVVDESGEDYLFDADRFFEIALPAEVVTKLEAA